MRWLLLLRMHRGFSSFESMSAQLPESQWSVHSDAMYFRNWPSDNVIKALFNTTGRLNLNGTG
jgi:hypothetical protein